MRGWQQARIGIAGIVALAAQSPLFAQPSAPFNPAHHRGALASGGPVAGPGGQAVTNPATQVAGRSPASSPSEGIEVRGLWTIDIRNPDGSLATHREFHNDLQPSGRSSLILILSRTRTPGEWSIALASAVSGDGACLRSDQPSSCIVAESTDPRSSFPEVFPNLVLQLLGGELILSGSAVAQRDGSIGRVLTYLKTCSATVDACVGSPVSTNFQFTATALTTQDGALAPISVSTGQQILVTVRLSFMPTP